MCNMVWSPCRTPPRLALQPLSRTQHTVFQVLACLQHIKLPMWLPRCSSCRISTEAFRVLHPEYYNCVPQHVSGTLGRRPVAVLCGGMQRAGGQLHAFVFLVCRGDLARVLTMVNKPCGLWLLPPSSLSPVLQLHHRQLK